MNKLLKITLGVGAVVVLTLIIFNHQNSADLSATINSLKNQNSDLVAKNRTLTTDNSNLRNSLVSGGKSTENPEATSTGNDKYVDLSKKFSELYGTYNVKELKQKRKAISKIATPEITDQIVPSDSFTTNKNDTKNRYSSDPTFTQQVVDVKNYGRFIDDDQFEVISFIQYETKSKAGNSKNTSQIKYVIQNKDGKLLVTNFGYLDTNN